MPYRVVPSPKGLKPFAIEVQQKDGTWKWARGAKDESEGNRIIRGLELLSRATKR